MTVDEALEYADEWTRDSTFHEHSTGWRITCAVLAKEVRYLRSLIHELGYVEADYAQLERIAELVKGVDMESSE